MDSIVTILEEPFYQSVKTIWKDLELQCGFTNAVPMTVPHFSWHVAESYKDEKRLIKVMETVCRQAKPFTVTTAGLGIFPAPKLVVNIALVKNRALLEFHQNLWELLNQLANQPSPHYAPESWAPHITLAYEEFTAKGLCCVMEYLLGRLTDWELTVNNLALISQELRPGVKRNFGG